MNFCRNVFHLCRVSTWLCKSTTTSPRSVKPSLVSTSWRCLCTARIPTPSQPCQTIVPWWTVHWMTVPCRCRDCLEVRSKPRTMGKNRHEILLYFLMPFSNLIISIILRINRLKGQYANSNHESCPLISFTVQSKMAISFLQWPCMSAASRTLLALASWVTTSEHWPPWHQLHVQQSAVVSSQEILIWDCRMVTFASAVAPCHQLTKGYIVLYNFDPEKQ